MSKAVMVRMLNPASQPHRCRALESTGAFEGRVHTLGLDQTRVTVQLKRNYEPA